MFATSVNNMDVKECTTVIKIYIDGDPYYLMIGWQTSSFDMCLYSDMGHQWKGRFSSNRMNGFSKNLHLAPSEYFEKIRRSLSEPNNDTIYEIKSGFFYWKRKQDEVMLLEGFLPVELITTNKSAHKELIDVLLAMNLMLRERVNDLQTKFSLIKADFHRCLKDTEEFLNLKVEMEKSLCDKFLNLVYMKRIKLEDLEKLKMGGKDSGKEMIDNFQQQATASQQITTETNLN